MPICKLCSQEKLLIEAHIIPKFMYKILKKNDRGYFSMAEYNLPVTPDGFSSKKSATGDWDNSILCKECDNKIGKYDTYASFAIFGHGNKSTPQFTFGTNQDGIVFYESTNFDYHKFKLFVLSILYKASISQRDFWKKVSLGYHEKSIAEMLKDDNPGPMKQYPFIVFSTGRVTMDLISAPVKLKSKEGITFYLFSIAGLNYLIPVHSSNHKMPKKYIDETVQENGRFRIHEIPQKHAARFLNKLIGLNIYK